jgi:hypothetical protein
MGYHNKEWAQLMCTIGLMPSDTGAPGGKQTGQRVSHYIIEGGPFDQAADVLLATGFCLNWESLVVPRETERVAKAQSKTKYTCPSCGQNAWAKPYVSLRCGACEAPMEAQA